ncbi:hypothetical protein A2276_04375 [candidate division WOR-1 bacterium RIFOXYA12_FULL_43_27]|uniref:RNA polymerase sigma-70 domain-containing protein n=1 Tax=candidate division WOR-1 bacterium RIFOXYC2_FULL_46_14 TaxID=1802587 RepID=A0A1F4U3Y9_UNCSA|nr:MAG: hypothetical protein A2276_04375 [candidate division WOR-1 bacterium RIFOXYA12_FULL_43_27]OGC18935.1 MAG: hypothetical protein A2292_08460 [candidate division WOR-1 bacterium RIFOXYB2_FULL_46_45]OGC29076.1 MAG: hypothetical protein A2232_03525 [candidate division WOR-1 bacterium RIFOXYA2_FULL_46_56]OGC39695.1 MAG: hypothetical protein A2438_06915 [candidate division WOR-1 bacterium RIFOXYC2_FULL_46_14]
MSRLEQTHKINCQNLICKIFSNKEIEKDHFEEVIQIIEATLSGLPEKYQIVIKLRYGLDGKGAQTLQQIGNVLGITRERVRQLENKALRRLKHPSKTRQFQQYFA